MEILFLRLFIRKTDPESVRREILAVQQIQSPECRAFWNTAWRIQISGLAYGFEKKKYLAIRLRNILASGPLPAESVLRLGLQMMEPWKEPSALRSCTGT